VLPSTYASDWTWMEFYAAYKTENVLKLRHWQPIAKYIVCILGWFGDQFNMIILFVFV